MNTYEESLIDNILARKEARERLDEEIKAKQISEATQDETDCRLWSVDTTVQYFIWVLQKKSPMEIEEIVSKLIDNIKG